MSSVQRPLTTQIVDLLRERGPLTMSKIASTLGQNPGGIRQRLLRMASTGRVTGAVGPDGWTVYSVPSEGRTVHPEI